MFTTTQLQSALKVSQEIDRLQGELHQVLNGGEPAMPAHRNGKKLQSLGKGLAPAVHEVLVQPMRVAEILEALHAGGYKFASSNPRAALGARIYKLRGIKKDGEGLFSRA